MQSNARESACAEDALHYGLDAGANGQQNLHAPQPTSDWLDFCAQLPRRGKEPEIKQRAGGCCNGRGWRWGAQQQERGWSEEPQ